MGLKRIGLIFDSVDLTHEHLMLSAHYQDLHRLTENGHAITRFITVRVISKLRTNEREPTNRLERGNAVLYGQRSVSDFREE